MDNMELYNAMRQVPIEAMKTIGAGRLKGMTDINPMWRLKKLTEEFGPCGFGWRIEIVRMWLEPGASGVIAAFVQIALYVKMEGEWSAGIPGIGGSSFVAQERGGMYTSDEAYKMAYTDAISVACKALGVAADVYYANDRTKYTNQEAQTPVPQQPASDPDMMAMALQEINGAQSKQTLAGIYNNYQALHQNPQFMQALTNKKNQLNNGTR